MRKLLLITLFSIAATIGSVAQVNIGYMNPAQVLSQLEEVSGIEQQIEQLIDQRDQELITKSTALQQEFAAYEQAANTMTPDQQVAKEQELLAKNQELEQERESYLNEIRQRRAQMMQPIIERMDIAIKAVATEMQLDLVLNEGTTYGDAIIFYAGEERLNISDRVLEKLKSE